MQLTNSLDLQTAQKPMGYIPEKSSTTNIGNILRPTFQITSNLLLPKNITLA